MDLLFPKLIKEIYQSLAWILKEPKRILISGLILVIDFTTKIDRLDLQLSNFYTNVRKIKVLNHIEDYNRIIFQGTAVKRDLRHYFGCEDYDNNIKDRNNDQKERLRAVSDSVVKVDTRPTFLTYYFRWCSGWIFVS